MKLLPFENITYHTKLDSEEILRRINEITDPKMTPKIIGNFGSGNLKPFEGTVDGNSFSIMRKIGYRNSFLPIIKGNITKDHRNTAVNVKMRLHPHVMIFLTIWCSLVIFFLVTFLIKPPGEEAIDPGIFVLVGMLLFAYVLTTGGFKFESNKARKFLAELFEADIKNKNELRRR